MRSKADCYDELREYLETVPLVDCHDHSGACGPNYTDPINAIAYGGFYFASDLISASSERDVEIALYSPNLPIEERWPVLERIWKRACHTGYAQVVRRVLKHFYGQDELTLAALRSMEGKLLDLRNEEVFDQILGEANIAVRLAEFEPASEYNELTKHVLDGSLKLPPRSRFVARITTYHSIQDHNSVQRNISPLNRNVVSLNDYIDACREILQGYRKFGAVAFKDHSAYMRSLQFGNPSRAEAEEVFNWLMEDPRRKVGCPDGARGLDDYLFHELMLMARDMDLPVQIHTGHLAGIRNDITNANAIGLRSIIELHRDVRFDLFHANWPYGEEILFLAKNYPNVTIDFCWTHLIDPVYCQRMLMQALSCVPHSKIHGYGSDLAGSADYAWAHASIARDNIAIALAEMVDIQYISLEDAKQVGHAWLFGNANEFFRLGL